MSTQGTRQTKASGQTPTGVKIRLFRISDASPRSASVRCRWITYGMPAESGAGLVFGGGSITACIRFNDALHSTSPGRYASGTNNTASPSLAAGLRGGRTIKASAPAIPSTSPDPCQDSKWAMYPPLVSTVRAAG